MERVERVGREERMEGWEAKVVDLLERLLAGMRDVLEAKLSGVYVYGSLTLGDFDLDISDVDLTAALSELTENDVENLRLMHDAVATEFPAWAGRIEVQYVSVESLRTFRQRPHPMAVISPGEPFHLIEAGADWLMNWYTVRQNSIALFGPPPSELIPEISREEFVAAARLHGLGYGDMLSEMRERTWQSYVSLTLCRALHLVSTGEQVSKRRAAHWAKQRFPDWAAHIDDAFRWRALSAERGVDHAQTWPRSKAFVSFAVDQLRN